MDLTVVAGIVSLLALLAGVFFASRYLTNQSTAEPETSRSSTSSTARTEVDTVIRNNRRVGGARRRAAGADIDDLVDCTLSLVDGEEEIDESLLSEKERKKLEKKRAKEAERLALLENQEKKEEKRSVYNQRQAEKDSAREEADAEAKKIEEELRKKQEEEDRKWMAQMSMDDSGDMEAEIAEESQGLLQEFISHICRKKVVVLEELAATFQMRTQDAIDRVTRLEEMGMISGVIDDRGKFIVISKEEMEKVAKFINRRGRVSIAELASESNKLIDLEERPEALVDLGTDDEPPPPTSQPPPLTVSS